MIHSPPRFPHFPAYRMPMRGALPPRRTIDLQHHVHYPCFSLICLSSARATTVVTYAHARTPNIWNGEAWAGTVPWLRDCVSRRIFSFLHTISANSRFYSIHPSSVGLARVPSSSISPTFLPHAWSVLLQYRTHVRRLYCLALVQALRRLRAILVVPPFQVLPCSNLLPPPSRPVFFRAVVGEWKRSCLVGTGRREAERI
ncbi:hypothetical protein EI94DRAFT_1741404, partial [Lactarius quietus]